MPKSMISVSEAKKLIFDKAFLLKPEKLCILDCLGMILAEDISANENIPSFDNSAMDGYAVKTFDLKEASEEKPAMLALNSFDIAAGSPKRHTLRDKTCIRIMTGAPVPKDCDCVVKKEDVSVMDDKVYFHIKPKPYGNIRFKGEDIKQGAVVLKKGFNLTPAAIGILAMLGFKKACVYPPVTAAVISTGNELVEIDKDPGFSQLRDSNSYSLCAQLKEINCRFINYGIVKDEKEKLKTVFAQAVKECDIVLISGGISVGDYDFASEALLEIGAGNIFSEVRQKPGKPLSLFEKNNKLIFALPGNPVSSMICFEFYVRPYLKKIMGHNNIFRKKLNAEAAEDIKHLKGRAEFFRVNLNQEKSGYYFCKTGPQGSGILTSMLRADAILYVDENKQDIIKGENLEVYLINN